MIKIQIPATSANLGSGFDSLGVALNMYNYVWMEETDETRAGILLSIMFSWRNFFERACTFA